MIHTWASDGRTRRYNVQVRPADMSRTTREILDFLSGSNNVRARAVGDRILVEGQNLTDEQLFRIDELAKRYPQIVNFTTRVGWERMILMDVKVVEFKKDKFLELGVRWATSAPGFNAGVAGDIIRGGFVVNPPAGTGGIEGIETLPRPIDPFRWYFGIVSAISSRLNLLEREGDAVVLATPQLTARSGSSAKFQAGGEIPYSVVGRDGFVTVQFKNFGIILEVSRAPTVQARSAPKSWPKSASPTPAFPLCKGCPACARAAPKPNSTCVQARRWSYRGCSTGARVSHTNACRDWDGFQSWVICFNRGDSPMAKPSLLFSSRR